ncbi:hypothetical protein [Chitinimonas sp. BJYL2]|uniref:hypothetical protein n=1 Tax=Chitinimonas sp. BJYL2 TaxID=2976696 RepID=UPI0022B4725C|nr:hypothetical protein [Chitinimonas sp. BJYL2]
MFKPAYPAFALAIVALNSHAAPAQKTSPPVAQAWIDLATYSGGMPSMPNIAGGLLGSMFGGSKGNNVFGNTQTGPAGRWMDVTVSTRLNPNLAEALQSVPEGSKLAPTLKLVSPVQGKPIPVEREEEIIEQPEFQRPKGKLLLYWGCGTEVRKGQPKVLDMATAEVADLARFFQARRATTRGAHSTPGRPIWPSKPDSRLIPADASLAGQHTFSGDGLPADFRFTLDQAHDLMPAIDLKQRDEGSAIRFSWSAMPQARAWFLSSMSAQGDQEMVIWTSSELADSGFGLLDYQPNAAVDRWLKEKVLLPARTTECTAPKEAIGKAGMVRMIAYGSELHLAHPPRPKDPKIAWEPTWAVKLRLKSVATSFTGMPNMDHSEQQQEESPTPKQEEKPKALDILKGIFGR